MTVLRFLRRTIHTIGRVLDAANRRLGRITARRLPQTSDAAWSENGRDVIGLRSKEH